MSDNSSDVAASSLTKQWFDRVEPSEVVVELGRLAALLREVSDLLHDSLPSTADVAELVTAAQPLLELARRLPVAPAMSLADLDGMLAGDALSFFDHSPLTGEASPVAPPVRMTREGDHVMGRVTFGRTFEGPPGHVHGGWVAAAFDEVMGMAQAVATDPGMTARLDVAYRRPTPLGVELVFDGWVDEVRGRKIRTKATLTAGDKLLAEASGLFISVDFQAMHAALGARPES